MLKSTTYSRTTTSKDGTDWQIIAVCAQTPDGDRISISIWQGDSAEDYDSFSLSPGSTFADGERWVRHICDRLKTIGDVYATVSRATNNPGLKPFSKHRER